MEPKIEALKPELTLHLSEFFRGNKITTWEGYQNHIKGMLDYTNTRTAKMFGRFSQQPEIIEIHEKLAKLASFELEPFKKYINQFSEQKEVFYLHLLKIASHAEEIEKKDMHINHIGALKENTDFIALKKELDEASTLHDTALGEKSA